MTTASREAVEFYVENQGDGWWHCPDRLHCVVVHRLDDALVGDRYFPRLLVRVRPMIEWNGDPRYAERWGPDHDLVTAKPPTDRLILTYSLPIGRDWSIPACPVKTGAPLSGELGREHVWAGLAIKASVVPVAEAGTK